MAHINWLAAQQQLSFSVWFLFCHTFSCACCHFIFFLLSNAKNIQSSWYFYRLFIYCKKKKSCWWRTRGQMHIHYNLCVLNCATHFNSFWYFAISTVFNRCIKKEYTYAFKINAQIWKKVSKRIFKLIQYTHFRL